jgi:hypothetical protein
MELASELSESFTVASGGPTQIRSRNGVHVDMPSGAAPPGTTITISPVARLTPQMGAPFAGPIYDIRVGNRDHFQFNQPVTVSVPFVPRLAGDEPVRLATFQNGRWVEVPCTVDRQRGVVTAQVNHASVWTTLRGAAGAAAGWVGGVTTPIWVDLGLPLFMIWNSDSVRAGFYSAYNKGSWEHGTKNFKIHYFRSGKHAVMNDSDYPLRGNRPGVYVAIDSERSQILTDEGKKAVPLYIQDLGELAESIRTNLANQYGMPFPEVRTFAGYQAGLRYDIFVFDLGDLGSTPMNGPVLLANNIMPFAVSKGITAERMNNATIAHELTHVAQGGVFSAYVATLQRMESRLAASHAMIEMTGAYMGDRFWEDQGRPTHIVRDFYARQNDYARFLTVSLDRVMKPQFHYSYAVFLSWLDQRKSGDGLRVVQELFKGGSASLEGLSAACSTVLGKPLPDALGEFAQAMYFDELVQVKLFPHLRDQPLTTILTRYSGGTMLTEKGNSIVDPEFANILAPPNYKTASGARPIWPWGRVSITPLPHLTYHALYIRSEELPEKRKPIYYLSFEPNGARPPTVVARLASGVIQREGLPAIVESTYFKELPLKSGLTVLRVNEEMEPPSGRPTLVTLLIENRSLTQDLNGMAVERWVLLAPEFVRFEREAEPPAVNSRRWTVVWHKAELSAFPRIFAGYNVYRKRVDEADSQFKRVRENWQDEVYTDPAPDDSEYMYNVKVVDRHGNESEFGTIDVDDPFVGVWNGTITLVDGSLADSLIDALKEAGVRMDREELESIAKEQDPARRAQRQKEWDQFKKGVGEYWQPVETLLLKAEFLLTVGTKVEFLIWKEKGGSYALLPTKLFGQRLPVSLQNKIAMTRTDRIVLSFADLQSSQEYRDLIAAGFPPIELRLSRMEPESTYNNIRTTSYKIPAKDKFQGAELKWSFNRTGKLQELNAELSTIPLFPPKE